MRPLHIRAIRARRHRFTPLFYVLALMLLALAYFGVRGALS